MTRIDWDCVIVTLGSEKQMELCGSFARRCSEKYGCRIELVCDAKNCRTGSGGAVLAALDSVENAAQKKILVVNSGGMSKRAVNYSLRGKAFANVAVDSVGEPLTLLDVIIENLSAMPQSFDAGLVVCCSDIPVDISGTDCSFETSVGFCIPCDLKTASRHGVMFAGSDGFLAEYIHKQSADRVKEKCREYSCDALLDTGLTFFSPDAVKSLCEMANGKNSLLNRLKAQKKELNLYSDIIEPMAEKSQGSAEQFEKMHGKKMRVCALNTPFTHYGTVREAIENIARTQSSEKKYYCFNSFVSADAKIGRGTVLDNAEIGGGCVIGRGCLVSDISLENVSVADGKAVCGIKLTDGSYVTIVTDADENPKIAGESGEQLWNEPRFCKGFSFNESYNLFIKTNDCSQKVSMAYCVENADYSYCGEWQKYLCEMHGRAEFEPYNEARKRIIDNYFLSAKPIETIECIRDEVCVRLPLRVNFSGTWTDCMPYCTDNGGAVVNAAITVEGEKPACVTAQRINKKRVEFCCADSHKSICIDDLRRIETIDNFDTFSLHKAALKIIGISEKTKLKNGIRLTTGVSGVMKGSGLGTSSTLLAGCFKSLGGLLGNEYSDSEIIRMVFAAEQLMSTGGGWQDQAATLTDSVKIVSAPAGIEQHITVKPIIINNDFARQLNSRLALVSTCQRHYGRFVVSDVMRRYMQNESESQCALKALFELNNDVVKCLEDESIIGFSACINRQWAQLRRLSPLITNERIDKIVDECEPLCDAVCICGAGAGGYLLAVMKENITAEILRQKLGKITDEVKKIEITF